MGEDSEARFTMLQQAGLAAEKIGEALHGVRTLQVDIVGLSIRAPRSQDEDILVTIRGVDGEGAPVVAFYAGQYLTGILVGIETQIKRGDMRWKPDQFAR